jgi:hypothetical protein
MNSCLICASPLKVGAAHNARYCSPRCRNKAFRQKEKGAQLPLRFQHEVDQLASKLGDTPTTFEWAGQSQPLAPFGTDIIRHDDNPRMWTIGRA